MASLSERVDEALGVIGRLAVVGGIALGVLFLLGIALKPLLPAGLPPGPDGRLLLAMLAAIAVACGTVGAALIFDRGRWENAGFTTVGLRPVTIGVSVGLGAMAALLPAALLLDLGAVRLEPLAPVAPFAEMLTRPVAMVLVVTLLDALIFRGYLHGALRAAWGPRLAVVLPALAFTLVRGDLAAADPGRLATTLALGLALGAVRERTGSVLAAWMLHAAFAWVQSAVLHVPVGGLLLRAPDWWIWHPVQGGWLSGGRWGVEGSAVTAATLLAITFLVLLARRPAARKARD